MGGYTACAVYSWYVVPTVGTWIETTANLANTTTANHDCVFWGLSFGRPLFFGITFRRSALLVKEGDSGTDAAYFMSLSGDSSMRRLTDTIDIKYGTLPGNAQKLSQVRRTIR